MRKVSILFIYWDNLEKRAYNAVNDQNKVIGLGLKQMPKLKCQ